MNRPRLKSRFFSIASSLLLAYCLSLPAFAEEVPLRAFTASYSLHKGNMHIGAVELSLEPFEQLWRWRLSTRARGIYAMLIHKKPYSETTFSHDKDDVRLQQIVISDEKDDEEYESANFDWEARRMKVLRKGKRGKVALVAEVYDYLSIHLLAAAMQQHQRDEETVDFYRKGKLVKSTLVYLGDEMVAKSTGSYKRVNPSSRCRRSISAGAKGTCSIKLGSSFCSISSTRIIVWQALMSMMLSSSSKRARSTTDWFDE